MWIMVRERSRTHHKLTPVSARRQAESTVFVREVGGSGGEGAVFDEVFAHVEAIRRESAESVGSVRLGGRLVLVLRFRLARSTLGVRCA